jgi:hypothetical protein
VAWAFSLCPQVEPWSNPPNIRKVRVNSVIHFKTSVVQFGAFGDGAYELRFWCSMSLVGQALRSITSKFIEGMNESPTVQFFLRTLHPFIQSKLWIIHTPSGGAWNQTCQHRSAKKTEYKNERKKVRKTWGREFSPKQKKKWKT